jgi:hypothetical protein
LDIDKIADRPITADSQWESAMMSNTEPIPDLKLRRHSKIAERLTGIETMVWI